MSKPKFLPIGAYKLMAVLSRITWKGRARIDLKRLRLAYQKDIAPLRLRVMK